MVRIDQYRPLDKTKRPPRISFKQHDGGAERCEARGVIADMARRGFNQLKSFAPLAFDIVSPVVNNLLGPGPGAQRRRKPVIWIKLE